MRRRTVLNLYNGGARGHDRAPFETARLIDRPASIIQHFCMLVESFINEEKALWGGCFSKVFDIGYIKWNESHELYG